MAPRVFLVRRSMLEWSARVTIAVATLVAGGFSIAFSLSQVIAKTDPDRAHRLAPYDGQITAALANRRFAEDQVSGVVSSPAPEQLARNALRSDPTAIHAVAVLGLRAQRDGEITRARRIFAYAQQLSRRDLQTTLWAIEDAVTRGDIPDALLKYDIALRTSKDAPDLLYPILAASISESDVRTGLVEMLARRPAWATSFMAYLSVATGDPKMMARFFIDLRRHGIPVLPEALAATTNRLVQGGAVADAWRFYSTLRPGVDRRRSRDPAFSANLAVPTVFDWMPVNDDNVSSSVQRNVQGSIFGFAAPTSTGGTVLTQTQFLPPGAYRISGVGHVIDQQTSALPYWVLTCANGRELNRVPMSPSNQTDASFAGHFSVPADCPIQTLALVIRPSDAIEGVSGEVHRVIVAPAS